MSPTMSAPATILFTTSADNLPAALVSWVEHQRSPRIVVNSGDELMAMALRGRPRLVLFDARASNEEVLAACGRLKRDSYTGVVPVLTLTAEGSDAIAKAFDAGADEVIPDGMNDAESVRRLESLLNRSDRDLGVHPSTRLPGAGAIEAEIKRRLAFPDLFAVCYADLDHFKEYNDRYSYNEGDRVIRILAMLLHDVVK